MIGNDRQFGSAAACIGGFIFMIYLFASVVRIVSRTLAPLGIYAGDVGFGVMVVLSLGFCLCLTGSIVAFGLR